MYRMVVWSERARAMRWRVAAVGLLTLAGLAAGCGGSSTPFQEPAYWELGTVVVGLEAPQGFGGSGAAAAGSVIPGSTIPGSVAPTPAPSPTPSSGCSTLPTVTSPNPDCVLTAVTHQINGILSRAAPGLSVQPQTDSGIAALVELDTSATAFYSLQYNGAPDVDDRDLKTAIDAINGGLAGLPAASASPPVWIVGASPDWAMVGAPTGGGQVGGSPGKPPTKADGRPLVPTSPANQPCAYKAADPTVYVLDTVDPLGVNFEGTPTHLRSATPTALCDVKGQLQSLSSTCHAQLTSGCPLLNDLTTYSSIGVVDNALPDEMSQVTDYNYQADGTYSFREHGLFVSELIHHLAPSAGIALVRVLNDYGAGDLRSLVSAFGAVYASKRGSPITSAFGRDSIVNLSLGLTPPTGCVAYVWDHMQQPSFTETPRGQYYESLPAGDLATCGTGTHITGNGQDDRLFVPLALAVEGLTAAGFHVIAAAGNESGAVSGGQQARFWADLPAAFCGVTAVAATTAATGSAGQPESSGVLAPFSNFPYVQDPSGCLSVPAGECMGAASPCVPCTPTATATSCVPQALSTPLSLEDQRQTDQSLYVLGTDVCSLDLQHAPLGIARWSGTSFATALASGSLASMPPAANGGLGSFPNQFDTPEPCL